MQEFLAGVDYPASKQDLITRARQAGADENVQAPLQRLPEQMYETPADVSEGSGRLE
jgi:hypothetical protein